MIISNIYKYYNLPTQECKHFQECAEIIKRLSSTIAYLHDNGKYSFNPWLHGAYFAIAVSTIKQKVAKKWTKPVISNLLIIQHTTNVVWLSVRVGNVSDVHLYLWCIGTVCFIVYMLNYVHDIQLSFKYHKMYLQ